MAKLWQRFVNGEQTDEDPDSVILRSWHRCRENRLDFQQVARNDLLPANLLQQRVEENEELLQAAKDVLPFLIRYLKGREFIVLLCDHDGYVLKALGHPTFLSKAQTVALSPGANWREEAKGTNAIGTALSERQAVKVLGWEHYVRENHFLNCWAAPIKDARGELLGVLDISGACGVTDERLCELVLMGTRMIEQNLHVNELQNSYRFCSAGIKMASQMLRDGFVTINNRGEITEINDAGVYMLGKRREDVLGRPAAEVFESKTNVSFYGERRKLPVSESGTPLQSSFNQVKDEKGDFLGAVGVLQPTLQQKEQTFWLGRSEETKKTFQNGAKAASTLSTVLIQGESGTGKEVMARYVHQMSPRHRGPFVALNCAAIPQTLIESELFGYADGSFTGAKKGGQPGKFEMAQNGTIFLDEVGDMPHNVQATLLRVLQEKEIYRIGDTKTRKVNARIIAATNQDLKKLVDEGRFRLDLYYRLKVVTLNIPPLRERSEDILDLVPYFVHKACTEQGRSAMAVSDALYKRLLAYDWPGNIRELQNCVESMVALAEGNVLGEDDLPLEVAGATMAEDAGSLLEKQTRQVILEALDKTKGKIAPAARMLGIGRTTLYRKMEEYKIKG
ncbi:sigma-54-dependent Fis family transcriptional regulator [Dethiobacter alkaliphilus]|uniref:sigma-54-dependent Fis family transcriptional regulator n=1 Tax=Dethiobacter alkaliphilus TaxID=427926 RepID=UPI0022279E00|nr:sigma-54-dependent Fis family transcriptional regulator [Dethiobacter alkaliphilus]MCW3490065.1 sigma-54-dependent Fis family transcriptional regulator [Dethiobacter alkaliphilus]